MLATRRELREVKRALREDIDRLDGWLKFANIALVPLLIGVGGLGWAALRRRRAHAAPPKPEASGRHAMKPTSFAALAVVTVLALAVAIAAYGSPEPLVAGQGLGRGAVSRPCRPGRPRIATIELKQGDKALTLARDKEAWSLADRGGYPAKADAVRALLVKLAQAELVEGKTSNKERYAQLELEEPAGQGRQVAPGAASLDDKGARSPRPSSARSASMRSAPARAAPTCASRATRRPGSAMPTSTCRWRCATGCSRALSISPRPRSPR